MNQRSLISSSNSKSDLTKTRLSTINQMRNTTLTTTKHFDPRTINDPKTKDEFNERIIRFLITESYDKSINSRFLYTIGVKVFYSVFNFIYKKSRPDFNEEVTEENIFQLLTMHKYPGTINKNHISVGGTHGTINNILALLAWFVDMGQYMQFAIFSNESHFNDSINNNSNVSTKKDAIDQRETFILVCSTFKAGINIDEEIEAMNTKALGKYEEIMNQNNQMESQIEKLSVEINKVKEIEENNKQLSIQLANEKETLNKSRKTIEDIFNQGESISRDFNELFTQNKVMNEKNDEIANDNNNIEKTIKEQKVSSEDYSKMLDEKQKLMNTHDVTSKRLLDVNDRLNQGKKKLSDKSQSINYDTKINKSISIDKFINLCIDKEHNNIFHQDIRPQVMKEYESLVMISNQCQSEGKEKNLAHRDKDLELLKLTDIEREKLLILSQRENEQKTLQIGIVDNTNKSDSFKQIYDIEVQKVTTSLEQIKKEETELRKKKDILIIKQEETITEFHNAEVETEAFFKAIKNEYSETLNDVSKIKQDNIRKIKANYTMLYNEFTKLETEFKIEENLLNK